MRSYRTLRGVAGLLWAFHLWNSSITTVRLLETRRSSCSCSLIEMRDKRKVRWIVMWYYDNIAIMTIVEIPNKIEISLIAAASLS